MALCHAPLRSDVQLLPGVQMAAELITGAAFQACCIPAARIIGGHRNDSPSVNDTATTVTTSQPGVGGTLQVVMFGLRKASATRVKQATMEFVVWVLQQASERSIAAMAPLAFRAVMSLLQAQDPHDASGQQLRGFLYQAAGQLAQVRPHCLPCCHAYFRASTSNSCCRRVGCWTHGAMERCACMPV